jgi:hypothetical protein
MDSGQWLTLVTLVVLVPLVGFWLALRQDSVRWYREKRADLYIDLLAEAHAERMMMDERSARDEIAQIELESSDPARATDAVAEFDAMGFPDTHLPPLERALLGARSAAYASDEVIRRFNRLGRLGLLPGLAPRFAPLMQRVEAATAFAELEEQIKRELRRYAPLRERWRSSRSRASKSR